MSSSTPSFVLDTNAYALFFQNPPSPALPKLEAAMTSSNGMEFHIPEIVSMEIHSVLGKYRRGGASLQHVPCERQIVHVNGSAACPNTCLFPARKRISGKAFAALQKMIRDIEAGRGDLRAKIIPVGPDQFSEAKRLLSSFADKYSFGSHDALVASTVLVANRSGSSFTLVTSDKSLKSVCAAIGVSVFDPIS